MAVPVKDVLLLPYVVNFQTRISDDDNPYKVSPATVTAYSAAKVAYANAYNAVLAARESGTRSESLTVIKDNARLSLLEQTREIYALVSANKSITDDLKVLLGVHVRSALPRPTPTPTTAPGLDIVSVSGRTIKLNIHDSTSSTKRRKAIGAVQAFVYTYVGATYPSDPGKWDFAGAATRSDFEVTVAETVPNGSQVWVCAAWTNRKAEAGPVSNPLSTFIQGGMSQAA